MGFAGHHGDLGLVDVAFHEGVGAVDEPRGFVFRVGVVGGGDEECGFDEGADLGLDGGFAGGLPGFVCGFCFGFGLEHFLVCFGLGESSLHVCDAADSFDSVV